MTPAERRRAWGLAAAVLGLHVAGFATLLLLVVPQHYEVGAGGQVFGLGLGITAYTLGLRHAFDADHIAAIDNTTRKLMGEGQRPLSTGFWFSLGHSSVVLALGVLVTIGVRGLGHAVSSEDSSLHSATGVIGPLVSGTFLLLIGLLNLLVLLGIVGILRSSRRGEIDEPELERRLAARGLLNRLLGRATRAVRRPWHMYPLGLLFGLGFDTATEVALLVLAGGAAAGGLPFYAILCLPILFAAGMALFDTIDGAFMTFAYGWAFARPLRKLYYNIAVTGLSVAVALMVGAMQLVTVLADRLALRGGFWDAATQIDLNVVGYVIVGLFAATWLGALVVWRVGRIEERWAGAQAPEG